MKIMRIIVRVVRPTLLISSFIFLMGISFGSTPWTRCLASFIGGLIIGLVAALIEFRGVRLVLRPGAGLSLAVIFSLIFLIENSGLVFSILFFFLFSIIFEKERLKDIIIFLCSEIKYNIDQMREALS